MFTLKETSHAVSTAMPTTQPISVSKPTGTNTVDNHYQLHVLSDIQNTIDRKPLNDEDIEKFVDQQKSTNTKQKNESDLRKWYQWSEECGETRYRVVVGIWCIG